MNMAVPSVSLPKVAAVGTAASTSDMNSINNINVDLSSMLEALHLDEYGAWYITALTAIYALNQKQVGKMEAKIEFEKELLEAKTMAEEAANAALIAAQGAKQAKELVMAMETSGGGEKKNVGEVMLENSKIGELTVLNVSKGRSERSEGPSERSEGPSELQLTSAFFGRWIVLHYSVFSSEL